MSLKLLLKVQDNHKNNIENKKFNLTVQGLDHATYIRFKSPPRT